jgi:hypothetical protein
MFQVREGGGSHFQNEGVLPGKVVAFHDLGKLPG